MEVVADLAGVRLPVAGVVAGFAAGNRGLVERWSGEWSPTWLASVCLWLGLLLGLPRGTVVELSGGRVGDGWPVKLCWRVAGSSPGLAGITGSVW